ncbi:MAG: UpxY family transcription antiterminator [Saprospiraceae bacterium]|nr:UpxY family transcription antiterminator [Candidatus Vicinibacter affinis]MBK7301636.1 UpxY family transcription antiterminator [Candidatus Vicinibacter affinis]MBK7692773.1 UpxY family transcription antiterminator [Candidatus Vicinibacter affinis]MBK7797578.1 UpxY family transcription antiterminator [Candidatus Vicinibacter affinis]MBK9639701.1 UpxY family transcription antiterminator [Candidatus Vicinibacter affinis]
MPSWKVLYIQGRYEFKVEQQLARLGIEHYLPKVQVMRQWSDRMKKLTVPAFPSYLFVCNEDKDRQAVFQAKGVLHYVRHENQDAIIREEELDLLRKGGSMIIQNSLQAIRGLKGKQVKIKAGLLAGNTGILVDLIGKKFVQLKLENLSMFFLVEIPTDQLQLN